MLPKGPYNPSETESEILEYWLKNQYYKPEYNPKTAKVQSQDETAADGREAFTIVLPPPNANGNLHLGHMSGYAYQDIMARYNRMKGKKVLLIPGKDHAGIQTEVVFEKELEKEGKSKQEIGRDEFYERCYQFCMDNSENARSQEKAIGLSADFDRELFTLDPKVVEEVLNAFTLMHQDGLAYRGKRLINWCVRCQSALADIDTEFKDAKTKFFYFKYAFTDTSSKSIDIRQSFATKGEVKFEFGGGVSQDSNLTESILRQDITFTTYNGTDAVKVLPLGFGFEDLKSDVSSLGNKEYEGVPIGVLMNLSDDPLLVVLKSGSDYSAEYTKVFPMISKSMAGGHIILFAEYPEDKYYTNGFILGTVRPETKFGDTALAVDPDDERYAPFVGNEYEVQTLNGETKLRIIADKAVDKNFGTGMVKVTPAHAQEDWEIAERHPDEAFPEKQVIGFDGKLNHLTGKYEGMTVNEARRQMEEDMKANGTLVHLDEEYENRVRICERCKSRIEPLISYQWFVDTKPLKEKAKKLVEEGITNIMPDGQKSRYIQWMESPEDWCITRQLWWGYRLPVWYKGGSTEYIDKNGEVKEMIGNTIIEKPEDYAGLVHVGLDTPEGDGWVQDEDVLDTWFSSGQWPYLTLKAHGLFDSYYPTDVMETGWDILIFWVTRMMMLNPYRAEKEGITDLTKQAPFSNVYLHGLVLDKNGVKMSKSKGNGVDPFEMMSKYGTDALRFSFVAGNAAGQNSRVYEEKIAANAKFCNKIWNASKFAIMNLEGYSPAGLADIDTDNLTEQTNIELRDHIKQVEADIARLMETFQFGVAAQVIFNEFWHNFCDLHIEAAKIHLYPQKDKETGEILSEPTDSAKTETQRVLHYALSSYLRMMHPFMPFITEKLWSFLPKTDSDSKTIMYANWPK